jgi:hypothetical protein
MEQRSEMNADKEAILRLMNEYCYRIDQGDLEGFADLFARGSFGIVGDPHGPDVGREALLATLRNVILYGGKPQTKHVMSNVQIDLDESGQTATAQCYITVFQALPDFPLQAIFAGHYRDRFARSAVGWHFVSRDISPDLLGDLSRHRADMA